MKVLAVLILVSCALIAGCDKEVADRFRQETSMQELKPINSDISNRIRNEISESININYSNLVNPNSNHEKGGLMFNIKNNSEYEIRQITFSFKVFAAGTMVYETNGVNHKWVISLRPGESDLLLFDVINSDTDTYHIIKSASVVSVKVEKVFAIAVKDKSSEIFLYLNP